MAITKARIRAQIQQDIEAHDALSEALKDILRKEVALAKDSYIRNERIVPAAYTTG